MVIGFKKQFVDPILKGTKVHSIREDKGQRWEPGRLMHMATGTRTKKYNQFALKTCIAVQDIEIGNFNFCDIDEQTGERVDGLLNATIVVDGRELDHFEAIELSKNDGFGNWEDFANWWYQPGDYEFIGKLIQWTDLKY